MPVRVFVSSAVANETLATPSRARTVWFTSSRVVAVTTHAPNRLGSFFEATTIVLPALASGRPYFSQQAAVSANAGSISINSYATPRASRAWTTRSSIIHYRAYGRIRVMPATNTAERRTNPPPVGIEVAVFSHTGGPP